MSALTSSQPNGCQAHQHLCSSPSPPTANGTGAAGGDGVHNHHHGTPCRAFCYKYYDFLANQKGNIWGSGSRSRSASDSGRYTNETTSTNDWDICWEYLRTHSCRDSHCTKRHIHFSDGHDLDLDQHDAPAHVEVGVGPQVQAQQQAQDICDVPEYVPLPTPSLISSSCSYSSALSSPSCVSSLPPPPSSLASSLPSLCSALTSTSISATSASSTHSHSHSHSQVSTSTPPPPDYSDVIKYVLWAIIKHKSCSSQRLVQVLKLNRNWINAVLYNFFHCGIIEANQQLRIYQLSRAFAAQYVQQTHPLMMQLQQKFGALELPRPSEQSQSPSDDQSTDHHHTNSICTNHADALFAQHVRVLKHVVNEQTCAVSTLSSLTGLDAQSVLASLAYWKSLGFELPHDNPYSTSTAEGEEHHHHHHHPHSAIAKTDKFICTVCRQRSTAYICIPCGHFCLCSQCKPKVYRQCPICWRQCSVIKVV